MITRRKLLLDSFKAAVVDALLPKQARAEPFELPVEFTLEGVTFTRGGVQPFRPMHQRVYVWQYFSNPVEPCGCGYFQSIILTHTEMANKRLLPEILKAKFEIAKLSLRRVIKEHRAPGYVHRTKWEYWDEDDD